MAQHYEKPSKLNAVSFLLILLAIAGAYGAIQFGPLYYHRWKAAGVLSESVNAIYPKRNAQGEFETQLYDELRKSTEAKLREIGITVPLTITFSKNPQTITGTIEYTDVVKHWFVNKTSSVSFRITESIKATVE